MTGLSIAAAVLAVLWYTVYRTDALQAMLSKLFGWVGSPASPALACKDEKLEELRERVRPLFNNNVHNAPPLDTVDMEGVLDTVTFKKGRESYTLNKEEIVMCMVDEHGHYYTDNMLLYVLLHELSHVLSESVGHTDEFHEKFQALLAKADDMGIYDKTKGVNKNYCLHNDDI